MMALLQPLLVLSAFVSLSLSLSQGEEGRREGTTHTQHHPSLLGCPPDGLVALLCGAPRC